MKEYIIKVDDDKIDVMGGMPLMDKPQELIRCKECINATMTADEELCKYCANDTDENGNPREVYHDANWFCPDGERDN